MLTILKESSKWFNSHKGWKFVLTAFFIAALDASTWFYTGDPTAETFDLVILLVGIFYLLYTETYTMSLSWLEFRWTIWRFCDKKPHQAYPCIILFILSIVYGNLYLSAIIIVILCGFFIYSLPNTNDRFGWFDFITKLVKVVRYLIPTVLMVVLFKNSLQVLVTVTSKSVIEILSFVIYEFLKPFLWFSFIPLVFYSMTLYYVYINSSKERSHYDCLLFSWHLQGTIWGTILGVILPICLNCGHGLSERIWCQNCGRKYFTDNLSKWTSGHESIDNLIKDIQLDAKSEIEYIDWIPYNEFKDIEQIGKGGFGTVYSAVWKSGPLT